MSEAITHTGYISPYPEYWGKRRRLLLRSALALEAGAAHLATCYRHRVNGRDQWQPNAERHRRRHVSLVRTARELRAFAEELTP